jgi:hypothetical protein
VFVIAAVYALPLCDALVKRYSVSLYSLQMEKSIDVAMFIALKSALTLSCHPLPVASWLFCSYEIGKNDVLRSDRGHACSEKHNGHLRMFDGIYLT